MDRNVERVTCKVAIYNLNYTKVLLAEYRDSEPGLIGGHLEAGENPDDALQREIAEETGIDGSKLILERADFWRHRLGKIILAYTACVDESIKLSIDEKELSRVVWVEVSKIASGEVRVPDYEEFIVQNAA